MKRFLLVIVTFLVATYSFAQKNEYRYLSIRLGTVNNYIFSPKSNEYLLMRTPYGDFYQIPQKYTNFTPGAEFNILYHIDAKNDKFGFVVGAGVKTYGNTIKYVSEKYGFKATDCYRAFSVVVPFYIKFSANNIYLNQAYMTFGFKQYFNIFVYNFQKASWQATNYIRSLSGEEYRFQSTAIFTGFNYNVFYFDLEYQLRSLLNKSYRTITSEGLVMPYKNLNFQANILFSMGIHIPLTRWTTMRYWAAEKVRRFFAPVR